MVRQSDFPSKWRCGSDDKNVAVEVRAEDNAITKFSMDVELAQLSASANDDDPVNLYEYSGSTEDYKLTITSESGTTPILSTLNVDVEYDGGSREFRLQNFSYSDETDEYFVIIPNDSVFGTPESAEITEISKYDWLEIPTSKVELYEEKGEAAAIQRTAKVSFPTTWGDDTDAVKHNSPRKLITEFDTNQTQPFIVARVRLKNQYDDFVTKHIGWVGGVGGTSNHNESKLWIYDFSEFWTGVATSLTFDNPTVDTAVDKIGEIITANTMTPLVGNVVVPPNTEAEYSQLVEEALQSGDIKTKGATLSASSGFYSLANNAGQITSGQQGVRSSDGVNLGVARINTKESKVIPYEPDSQHFSANRDTLRDVIAWFEQKTSAKMHYEPAPNGDGVILVADIVPTRHIFAQRRAIFDGQFRGRFHDAVDIRQNTALYEINPTNTVILKGAKPDGLLKPDSEARASGDESVQLGPFTFTEEGAQVTADKYPYVKVTVPSLVEAAEGTEVAGKIVESDARSLQTAEAEAISILEERLSNPSEGTIQLKGEPRMSPYDVIHAYETCGERIQYDGDEPLAYEVEQVKHTIDPLEGFESETTISIFTGREDFEIVESKLKEG